MGAASGGADLRARSIRTARPGGHDWDRRRDQLYRQVKGIGGPDEHRDQILAFLDSHRGVEAYVEPRTVMHPLSVVFVDAEGVAKRFELREDAFLRELAKTRGLPVFDATASGIPSACADAGPNDDDQRCCGCCASHVRRFSMCARASTPCGHVRGSSQGGFPSIVKKLKRQLGQ